MTSPAPVMPRRARALLMEIWTGWLMGISEDARARITLVDGALAGREQWARTFSEGWSG